MHTFELHPRTAGDNGAGTQLRMCNAPECRAEGLYRAPVSRHRLTEYYWFCLDHVRSYNASWNFYAGMSEREIEAYNRADTTWWRPTWPLGGKGGHGSGADRTRRSGFDARRFGAENIRDGFGFFTDAEGRTEGRRRAPPRTGNSDQEALQIMDLPPNAEWGQIKARYKELVKAHHPDANGGDKAAEERLKSINQAYTTLKKSLSP
ncbi:MAG: molecular chaperone DnaJ [Alphaproteobacteria bacterium]|nr:molecular chaperone DnaJ [Alphaproteobacteria bacterium]